MLDRMRRYLNKAEALRALWALLLALWIIPQLGGCSATPAWMVNDKPSWRTQYALSHVSPAVVRINVVMRDFRNGVPENFRAIGSGVIIDKQGRVLTNFHVAGRARRIEIILPDQERVRATLIGSDHWTDLALVQMDMAQIKARHLHFKWATLGNSRHVQLGEPVLAIGTPYGLSRTVTSGIISDTDRFFNATTIDGYETGWFNNWLQTDAAINPGNSGGPLINLRGHVIGINTRGDPTANNLGFAIPINVARRVIPSLLKDRKVSRSYIGLELEPMLGLSRFYHLPPEKGVLIRSVDHDSPASAAGVHALDVLLSVDGYATNCRFPEQISAVRRYVADQPVGSTLTLVLDRMNNGSVMKQKTLHVVTQRLESVISPRHQIKPWGIVVRNLTSAFLRQQQMKMIRGVLVTSVQSGSIADSAGMEDGDIIRVVGATRITDSVQLKILADRMAKTKKPYAVVVKRGRAERTLVFTPGGGS
ncbi:MAG: trypsin-like peptidase domain-containing protein [Phycisphaerae bacterium]